MKRRKAQERILKSLLDISGFTGYVENPSLILSLIIEESILLTRAEWGAIISYDSHFNVDSFQTTEKADAAEKAKLSSVLHNAVKDIIENREKEDVLSEAMWNTDGIREIFKQCIGIKIRSILICPIRKKDAFLGLVIAANKRAKHNFTKKDAESINIVCQEASIVLENIRLFKTKLQNEKMAAIGQTMTGISHYIKNILQGISAGSHLLSTGIEKNDISSIENAWAVVDKNTKRISDLIMDMLYYSKDRKLLKQKIDPSVLLKDVIELVGTTLKEKKINLKLSVANMPERITANERGLHRSILNLIVNALEACDKPNSEVRIEAAQEKVSGALKITVSDNGRGMSRETSEKVFRPFYTSKDKGTGLGLAITQKIIEEHGGSIKVASELGKGTTFEVFIPV